MFQSTLPHGERQQALEDHAAMVGFNPRSRMGSDFIEAGNVEFKDRVSIHAPAWGATFWQIKDS